MLYLQTKTDQRCAEVIDSEMVDASSRGQPDSDSDGDQSDAEAGTEERSASDGAEGGEHGSEGAEERGGVQDRWDARGGQEGGIRRSSRARVTMRGRRGTSSSSSSSCRGGSVGEGGEGEEEGASKGRGEDGSEGAGEGEDGDDEENEDEEDSFFAVRGADGVKRLKPAVVQLLTAWRENVEDKQKQLLGDIGTRNVTTRLFCLEYFSKKQRLLQLARQLESPIADILWDENDVKVFLRDFLVYELGLSDKAAAKALLLPSASPTRSWIDANPFSS